MKVAVPQTARRGHKNAHWANNAVTAGKFVDVSFVMSFF
jgi:hypothetical protein